MGNSKYLDGLNADDAGAEGHDVGVVVLARKACAVGLGAHDGADALDLVGS